MATEVANDHSINVATNSDVPYGVLLAHDRRGSRGAAQRLPPSTTTPQRRLQRRPLPRGHLGVLQETKGAATAMSGPAHAEKATIAAVRREIARKKRQNVSSTSPRISTVAG